MKNFKTKIMAVIAVLLLAGIYYYVALPAINIHSTGFWIFLIMLLVLAAVYYVRKKRLNRYELKTSKGLKVILGHIPILPEQHREKCAEHPVPIDTAGQKSGKYRRNANRIKSDPQPQRNGSAVPKTMLNANVAGDQTIAINSAVSPRLQQFCSFIACRQRRRSGQYAALIQDMQDDDHPHGQHPQQVDSVIAPFHHPLLSGKIKTAEHTAAFAVSALPFVRRLSL